MSDIKAERPFLQPPAPATATAPAPAPTPAPAQAPAPPTMVDRAALRAELDDLLAKLRRGEGDPEGAARIAELNRVLDGQAR